VELIAVYSAARLKSARVAAAFSEPSGRIFWATSSRGLRSTSARGLVQDALSNAIFASATPAFGSSGTVLSRPPIGTATRPASRDGLDVEPPTPGQHDTGLVQQSSAPVQQCGRPPAPGISIRKACALSSPSSLAQARGISKEARRSGHPAGSMQKAHEVAMAHHLAHNSNAAPQHYHTECTSPCRCQ
jgi:hypothetical protein